MTAGSLLAGSFADELERVLAIDAERAEAPPTFREFLEFPEYAGAYMAITGISPVLAAIADASEGSPVESLSDKEVIDVFHCRPDELPLGTVPRVVVVNAGRQAGKTSGCLAPKCVHAAWTQPAPFLRPGQVARCTIISPKTELSRSAFRYCRGIVSTSPRLSRNIVKMSDGNLRNVADEQILLRRPDGHLVEIVVGPADAGGAAARSATLLFCGLDEAAFFFADDGHTVNDRAIFDAAMGTVRNLKGAQIWITSTPWIEGSGLMEELVRDHWGRPGGVLVAARISSYALRGIVDDGSLREETDTDETYDREVLAHPLTAGAQTFFSHAKLAAALLRSPPDGPPEELGAGGDFAYERDALAIAVVHRYLGGYFAPVVVEERHATPGNLTAVALTIRELGELAAAAGAKQIAGDPWKRSFCREALFAAGLGFVDAPGSDEGKAETYGAFKKVLEADLFCLAHLPPKVARYIVDQLGAVVATPIPGPGNRFKLTSPRTKRLLEGVGAGKIGSHGDLADAIIKGTWQAGSGRTSAGWNIPRQAAARARPAPVTGLGAGGSAAWLRGRSGSAFAGRGLLGGRADD